MLETTSRDSSFFILRAERIKVVHLWIFKTSTIAWALILPIYWLVIFGKSLTLLTLVPHPKQFFLPTRRSPKFFLPYFEEVGFLRAEFLLLSIWDIGLHTLSLLALVILEWTWMVTYFLNLGKSWISSLPWKYLFKKTWPF